MFGILYMKQLVEFFIFKLILLSWYRNILKTDFFSCEMQIASFRGMLSV